MNYILPQSPKVKYIYNKTEPQQSLAVEPMERLLYSSPPTAAEVEAGNLPLLVEVGMASNLLLLVDVGTAGNLPLLVPWALDLWALGLWTHRLPPLSCGRSAFPLLGCGCTDFPLLGCGCIDSPLLGARHLGSSHSGARRSGSSHSRSISCTSGIYLAKDQYFSTVFRLFCNYPLKLNPAMLWTMDYGLRTLIISIFQY
ncbi:UNVERIFIED_CONTAM: hypothetical protein FKN15_031741 [Acipenser sinensis]